MPKKNNPLSGIAQLLSGLHRGPALGALAALLASSAVIMFINGRDTIRLGEFEAGKVADRDVIASEPVSFIDEDSTRLRTEVRIKLVPAVFKYSAAENEGMRKAYDRFLLFSKSLFDREVSPENYRLLVSAEFPGLFGSDALEELYTGTDREISLDKGRAMLDFFIETGIFVLPKEGLGAYNPDMAELIHNYGPRAERERINYDRIITMDRVDAAITRYIQDEHLSPAFAAGAAKAVRSVLRGNVFFSPADTEERVAEVRSQIEPVYHYIERGDRIIRRGFIITEGEMEELRALNLSLEKRDPRLIAGQMLRLVLIFLLLIFHMGKRTAGRELQNVEIYLMTILSAAYLTGAALAGSVRFGFYFPVSIILPTALVVMLPGILLGFPMAMVSAIILPLGAFLSESFDDSAFLFALCSGVAASLVLRGAQKRMDLVRAGLQIAAANAAAALTVLLLRQAPAAEYLPIIFWAAFNGLASGLFVIGLLPVTEQALNAVTPFRLIELSDLNSPLLKRLFSAAPGTYSHSLMVASLAETACQEIGANALLAQVGSYYHDIGKMEQPDYFVENQTSYNKHKDISPRLSAAVIKNHVKLGVERARSMGLPEAIVAFIAEHHGNSVITWFYNEALKQEKSTVNMEDFIYPGRPPRTKETAVVMLADVTEAAVRTLKKPTAARLEKYIQELFDAKIEHGQLSESDLTFRELEIIKQAFVKVLTGHYHSRIEYPKLPAELRSRGGTGSRGESAGEEQGDTNEKNGSKSAGEGAGAQDEQG